MKNRDKLKTTSVIFSMTLVIIMFTIKIIAFMISGSISVLASLIDSGADIFTSAITATAVYTSIKPANKKHKFGHGKAESIGAFLQSIFIFISAGFLLWQTVIRVINQYEMNIDLITLLIMIISLILTLTMVSFQRYVIRKTNSISIKADNVNYTGDIFTTLGVIISLIITKATGIYYVDAIFAIMIVVFLCRNAKELMAESLHVLLDGEIEPKLKNKIKTIIRNHPGVLGYHDFRSRFCGRTYYIEFHIELDGNQPLSSAHEISHTLKEKIKDSHENMDITIHQDIHYD